MEGVLCAAIDIGSNTTRLLVAELQDGQMCGVMDQKVFTRLGEATLDGGTISAEKVAQVADAVATQRRLAEELDAEAIRIVATAAMREAANRDGVTDEIGRACGLPVEVLSEQEEGRLAFLGATRTLVMEGEVAVVDVGGGSTEIVLGTLREGVRAVHSFKVGSGSLADRFRAGDPPSAADIHAMRDHVAALFGEVEMGRPDYAVAVGGSASSLRKLVGGVLEYETLERAIRVLTAEPIAAVSKRFELDPRRVQLLPAGVLLLEQISELIGCPLQIGKGGLREGVILDLLNGGAGDGAARERQRPLSSLR
jgi:exopolyphosphatase / guanosine-5'-triphosphate,3'-diphosphate pyrophosphatase